MPASSIAARCEGGAHPADGFVQIAAFGQHLADEHIAARARGEVAAAADGTAAAAG
jgi:hypothetical protein